MGRGSARTATPVGIPSTPAVRMVKALRTWAWEQRVWVQRAWVQQVWVARCAERCWNIVESG